MKEKHRNDYFREAAYKKLKDKKGEYIEIIKHLSSCLSDPETVLYAGETDKDEEWSQGLFLTGKGEELDGRPYFFGYQVGLHDISDYHGTPMLCFTEGKPSRIYAEGSVLERLVKIWEKRKKPGRV